MSNIINLAEYVQDRNMKGKYTPEMVVDSLLDVDKIENLITIAIFKDERGIVLSHTSDNDYEVVGLLEKAKSVLVEDIR